MHLCDRSARQWRLVEGREEAIDAHAQLIFNCSSHHGSGHDWRSCRGEGVAARIHQRFRHEAWRVCKHLSNLDGGAAEHVEDLVGEA